MPSIAAVKVPPHGGALFEVPFTECGSVQEEACASGKLPALNLCPCRRDLAPPLQSRDLWRLGAESSLKQKGELGNRPEVSGFGSVRWISH